MDNFKVPGQCMEPPGFITPSNGFSSPPVHQHTLTATSSMQCSELVTSGTAPVPPAASLYVPPCHKERKGSQSSSCSSGSLVAVNGYGSNGIASSREAKINGDWRARDEPKSGEQNISTVLHKSNQNSLFILLLLSCREAAL